MAIEGVTERMKKIGAARTFAVGSADHTKSEEVNLRISGARGGGPDRIASSQSRGGRYHCSRKGPGPGQHFKGRSPAVPQRANIYPPLHRIQCGSDGRIHSSTGKI